MCELHEHTPAQLSVFINRYDPTRTTALRNNCVIESNRRFNELISEIKKAVIEKDVFGLVPRIHTLQAPFEREYEFLTDAGKIQEFTYWLEGLIRNGLLNGWPNKHITDAYRRGILRALEEMRKAKYKVPWIADIGGEEVMMSFSSHINTLELLYLRVFSELRGITSQMEQHIARVLAEGFINNESYTTLARKLVAVINGQGMGDLGLTDVLGRYIPAQRRAEILVRTEIVRAHHLAMMQEYKRWGVEGIMVRAEWRTAGDDRVCLACASLECRTFTIEEIEPMIPLHPQCRCIAIPILK